jgi:tRNA(fMet)-specific endonuclease VapC
MNGKRILLDTNVVISLLRGEPEIAKIVQTADWIGISILSVLEYRSFSNLCEDDVLLFKEFTRKIDVIDLSNTDDDLIEWIIDVRRKYRFKLPDAIIVATALLNNAQLVTRDKALAKTKETDVILL